MTTTATGRAIERMSLAPHARRSLLLGLAILFADFAAWIAFAYGAVAAETLALKLLLSVLAGGAVALLAIVGHDAAHQSFLPGRLLNDVAGTLAFLPALHAYSLWEHHHNRVHHRFTAQIGLDNAFSPMTVDQWRGASWARKARYRFMRSLWGQPFFYLVEVWWPDIFMPFLGARRPTPANLIDLAIVYLFVPACVFGFAAMAVASGARSSTEAALLDAALFALLIPFLVWNAFISFVTIVQHTGPDVRWVLPTGQPSTVEENIAGTVHVRFPEPVDWLMHRVMRHQAHHVHMGVPMYRLKDAQDDVTAAVLGRNTCVWTPAYHLRLTRECKLYDPARHAWTTFDVAAPLPQTARAA